MLVVGAASLLGIEGEEDPGEQLPAWKRARQHFGLAYEERFNAWAADASGSGDGQEAFSDIAWKVAGATFARRRAEISTLFSGIPSWAVEEYRLAAGPVAAV